MKKILLITVLFALVGCSQTQSNSENSNHKMSKMQQTLAKNMMGEYSGKIPCADCKGIVQTIKLMPNNTYTKTQTYLKGANKQTTTENGKYSWIDSGSTIKLVSSKNSSDYTFYKVSKNSLTQLDQSGKAIKSKLNYTLKKVN